MHRYRRVIDDGRAVEVEVKDTENAVTDEDSARSDDNTLKARILDKGR